MEITLTLVAISFGTAILNELIKLIPAIGQNELIRSAVAVVVIAILAFLTNGLEWSWLNFYAVMAFAFLNYKMIVQPIATAIGSPSQPRK